MVVDVFMELDFLLIHLLEDFGAVETGFWEFEKLIELFEKFLSHDV